ncbi:MAG TPA: GDSL-type esterase/lipase family protein [Acidimicrobiia bacterium]|nr:GDSL-type esterase/lipase family protein [Acidimicrobiia bacterium]
MSGRRRVVMELLAVVLAATFVTVGIGGLGGSGAALTPHQAQARTESVLLVGDSLLHQAAAGMTAALPGSSVVDASVPGSGLLNGGVDWYARAEALVEQYHPDVVVVSFVGNYDRSSATLVVDSPEYYDAWNAAAQRLTDRFRAAGARVDWVVQPPLHDPNFYGVPTTRPQELSKQYATLARQPGVDLLDAVAAVSAADGGFAEQGTICGSTVTLRIADGVHFTAAGAAWWGVHLARALARLDGLAATGTCTAMSGLDRAA